MNKYLYTLIYWTIASVLIGVLFLELLLSVPIAFLEALESSAYYHLTKNT